MVSLLYVLSYMQSGKQSIAFERGRNIHQRHLQLSIGCKHEGPITQPAAGSPDNRPSFSAHSLPGQLQVFLAATIGLTHADLFTTCHHQSFQAHVEEHTSSSIPMRFVGSCPAKSTTTLCNAFKHAAPAVCPICKLRCVLLFTWATACVGRYTFDYLTCIQ